MASRLQRALVEADYLNPFQSGFRLGFGTEMSQSLCWMTCVMGKVSSIPISSLEVHDSVYCWDFF